MKLINENQRNSLIKTKKNNFLSSSKFFILFSEISEERLDWFSSILNEKRRERNLKDKENIGPKIDIYLTGTAIYGLFKPKLIPIIKEGLKQGIRRIKINKKEAYIRGITKSSIERTFPNYSGNISMVEEESIENSGAKPEEPNKRIFWRNLLEELRTDLGETWNQKTAFLQLKGPYMSRTSVETLRFLEQSIDLGFDTHLYNYMDGIHMGHAFQSPSEFENIEHKLKRLLEQSHKEKTKFNILTCSRCAAARGYFNPQASKDTPGVMQGFGIQNLNNIINHMEENRVILSHNCGIGLNKGLASEIENIFLITNPPYISENAFGALSMAMASANHDILTKVVFIEDGIYCLSGIHEIQPDDHIFNVQDIIESTGDMESLQYYLYEPSVEMRGVDILDYVKEFKTIQSQGLKDVLFDFNFEQTQGKPKMRSIKHKRIIFY